MSAMMPSARPAATTVAYSATRHEASSASGPSIISASAMPKGHAASIRPSAVCRSRPRKHAADAGQGAPEHGAAEAARVGADHAPDDHQAEAGDDDAQAAEALPEQAAGQREDHPRQHEEAHEQPHLRPGEIEG